MGSQPQGPLGAVAGSGPSLASRPGRPAHLAEPPLPPHWLPSAPPPPSHWLSPPPPRALLVSARYLEGSEERLPLPPSFPSPPLPLAAEPACRALPLAAGPAARPDWRAAARRPAPRGAERRVWAGELPAPLGSAGLRAARAGRPLPPPPPPPAGERRAEPGMAAPG